jgi:hypothetical protein
MIVVQGTAAEAQTASAIAYKNAIASGADEAAAGALATATMANYQAKAAREAERQAQALQAAAAAAEAAAVAESMVSTKAMLAAEAARLQRSYFEPVTMPTKALTFTADPTASVSYRGGGTGKRLDTGTPDYSRYTRDPMTGQLVYGPAALSADEASKAMIEAQQKNTDSIEKLKDSTDKLTKSNEDLLSPYYTQDPRTSHIGFRSQGMAAGGYVDVPGGASANDNMTAIIPVASGERIYVDPMSGRRDTSGGGMTINISSPITINGNANKDEFSRTVYQSNQMLAKQVRAAAQ